MRALIVPLLFLGAFGFLFCGAELENTAVQRSVDLSTQVYRETVQLSITNVGNEVEKTYDFVLEHPDNIALFDPRVKKSDKRLPFTFTKKGEHHIAVIELETPLKASEKAILVISIAKTHVFRPYPKEVGQNEKQQMLYVGNFLYPSVYTTLKTKTSFSAPNEEVTVSSPDLSVSANKVTFGPSTDKFPPHSYKEAHIHYTNNARFLVSESLVRTLEISHWGNNLAYEEFYDAIHGGATLKGYYSRLEYDREAYRHHETPVIKSIEFELPPDSTDVYYRDIIGNVSTSNFRSSPFETSSVLELRPRFPLFGGWRTSWYHGYNTLLSNSLQVSDDGSYILNFLFVNPYEDAVIDDFTLRVTLPEGASDIQFHSDFDLQAHQTTEVIQTYLDTIGRPVVVIKRKNVVNEHKVPVQITYRYGTTSMLHEPLLLTGFYFFLFVISMLFIRLDLSISSPERELLHDFYEKEQQRKNQIERVLNHRNDKTTLDSAREETHNLDKKLTELKDAIAKIDNPTINPTNLDNAIKLGQNRWKRTYAAVTEKQQIDIGLNAKDDEAIEKILTEYL